MEAAEIWPAGLLRVSTNNTVVLYHADMDFVNIFYWNIKKKTVNMVRIFY